MTGEARRPTVLFVDDDPSFLLLVERGLHEESWKVLKTTDPLKALPLLEWENVDVLVADLLMPEVNGVDLLVRARKLFPWVPRLALTCVGDSDRLVRTINEAEVFRFLRKPIQIPELRDAVGEALRRRELLRPAESAERAGTQRAEALKDLRARHPGIETTGLRDGVHVVSDDRLADLEQRFRGGPFDVLLSD
ncbi:MAG TPA: response regulator [Vicinamibacteria bacterium]|jgi:DNA-binding NtrC family response regulator